jgi:hypothetical protein
MTVSPHVAAARDRWPYAAWIIGDGPWASVAYCDDPTVMLFGTQAEADHARAFIDRLACGHACVRQHEIVHLPEGEPKQ